MDKFSRPTSRSKLVKHVLFATMAQAIAQSLAVAARDKRPPRETFARLREEEARQARRHPGKNDRRGGRK